MKEDGKKRRILDREMERERNEERDYAVGCHGRDSRGKKEGGGIIKRC